MSLRTSLAAVAIAAMTTPAWAQPAQPQPQPQPRVVDPQERLEWTRFAEEMAKRYEQAADEQQARMRALLVREFDRRLAQLNERYADKLTNAQKMKRQRQLEAIALLEKFIQDHPNHELHTPDAMYRLASLYLDQAETTAEEQSTGINIVDADYGKSLDLWERIIKEFPEYRQLGATMYLYATYIGTRPIDDETEERRAIQVYRALVCANKFEPFGEPPAMLEREEVLERLEGTTLVDPYQGCQPVPNTSDELILYGWVRGVGASHFATPGEMDEAIASYSYGLDDQDHKLYDEALYMLAWSYYRRDILDKALELFDKSVVRYDKVVAAGGKPGLALREEALQYIAVTLTDPWEGEIDSDPDKAWERATRFYEGRENEPHVREVWVTLGKAFYDLGGPALDRSVQAYRKAISEPWHLHPDNPLTHLEIVKTLERKGDKAAANQARAELATSYSPCPPEKLANRQPGDPCGRWYEANETNRVAMENYRAIGEKMLAFAATDAHQQAIDAMGEWQAAADGTPEKAAAKQRMDRLYAQALAHYRSFIETYPASKYIYDFTMGIGEILFYTGRYLDQPGADGVVSEDEEGAVRHYAWVRDHRNLSSEHFEDAVFKIVKSYELATDQLVAEGRLKPLAVPQLEEVPAPEKIPAPHLALQRAYDDYARLVNHADKAPSMGYNAGLVSLAYYHVDDAIKRFERVLNAFCGQEKAMLSKEALLAIHTARGNDEAFRRTNQWFISKQCGDAEAIAKAETQNRKLALRAARKLEDTNKLADAAQAYYQYFHDAPADDDERAAALYNSAQLYEAAGQPRRAIYLYKEFSKRAESKDADNEVFRNSPYRLPSMILHADSLGNAYEYEEAAEKYLEVYKLATDPKRYGVEQPTAPEGEKAPTFDEIRRNALSNAAAFYELDRDFANALRYYDRYEKIEVDRRKKDRAAWAIARIHKSSGKLWELEKAWRDWRRTYGNDQGNELDLITSYYDLARLYDERAGRNNQRKANGFKKDTIDAWQKVSWDSVDPNERVQAARMAGEYDFEIAENHYQNKWVPAKITRRPRTDKDAKRAIESLENDALEAIKKFEEVGQRYSKYTLQYAIAGNVRIGKIYLDYNLKVFTMPVPKFVLDADKKNPGFIAHYEEALRKQLEKLGYREIAKKKFLEVVELAKKPNVVVPKKWVTMAKDELNREYRDVPEFPILNAEIAEGTELP